MNSVDMVIQNGRVIDPANNIDDVLDVAIKDDKIFAVGKELQLVAKERFDASGCLVTPGLIDAHVHCYEYATPLGVNPDRKCLARGVTTIVDAGSAGASTFQGLRKYIIEPSKTRVVCLLHIAMHGLAAAGCASGAPGGESDTLAILDMEECKKCIIANRDVIVGVKVRLSASVCCQGNTEAEAYRRAMQAAADCGVPLMTHHSQSTIPTQRSHEEELGCPGSLKPGDIYTHLYHGHRSTIVDVSTRDVFDDVMKAQSRGVYMDVGHGAGGFNWTVAEEATRRGLWPDLLGTDLHEVNVDGPAYDLPTVMSKFLYLGMPLKDIIRTVTSTPAAAYRLEEIGALTPGKHADVTVMRIDDVDVMMEDTQGQVRRMRHRIVPVGVFRAGRQFPIELPEVWPNIESRKKSFPSWDVVVVKDDTRPSL